MAYMLGYVLAKMGHKVLLVDLDPQASLTDLLGYDPTDEKVVKLTTAELLYSAKKGELKPKMIEDAILVGNICGKQVHLIAGSIALEELNRGDIPYNLLKDVLSLIDGYDVIIVDTPPGTGWLTILPLVATDLLLTPVEVSKISIDTLRYLKEAYDEVKSKANERLEWLGIIPNKCEVRTRLFKKNIEYLKAVANSYGVKLYNPIPKTQVVEEFIELKVPLEWNRKKTARNILKLIEGIAKEVMSFEA